MTRPRSGYSLHQIHETDYRHQAPVNLPNYASVEVVYLLFAEVAQQGEACLDLFM